MMQLGPGMYSQRSGPCDECSGQGEMIDKAKRCKTCLGKKIKKETKSLKVEVDKGSPNGEKFTIHGEADEMPDAEAGDVIVQIIEKPNKELKRKGADLLMEKEISLLEALTGVDFIFKHLDGRKIRIKNDPGQVVKPEMLMSIMGQGMPFFKKSYEFGNLFVRFTIKFPVNMNDAQLTGINSALSF